MNDKPSVPDVTVVVGAYEAMPYLIRCLESVESQTLGADRIEIVAVDDGSTDGTGEYLDEFAARSKVPTRVIHQANSGGPSGPRNVGLRLARGRFVFFLDADDFFGDEALERLVAMADRAGTDVVLGRLKGVGRKVGMSMFARTEERVDVYSSRVIFALSAQKLFRRELLSRLGLEFDETLPTGEDALFTMEAYLQGNGVSVVADYDCYHLVARDDGKHATRRGSYPPRFAAITALTELIVRLEPAGPKRDQLLVRPFTVGLLQQFGPALLKETEEVRRHKLELAAPVIRHWSKGVADRIKVGERLVLACVAAGRLDVLADVLEFVRTKQVPRVVAAGRRGRLFLAYPHFENRQSGIPRSTYAVTVPDWSGSVRVPPPNTLPSLVRRTVRRARRSLRKLRVDRRPPTAGRA
ncbi:glycosyltransferase family 2 protein [Streptomyces xantholiticus]